MPVASSDSGRHRVRIFGATRALAYVAPTRARVLSGPSARPVLRQVNSAPRRNEYPHSLSHVWHRHHRLAALGSSAVKALSAFCATMWLALAFAAQAGAPEVEWQNGKCLGGLRPSRMCKNCSTCAYCGKNGRYGARPENSATCWVCEHLKDAPAK